MAYHPLKTRPHFIVCLLERSEEKVHYFILDNFYTTNEIHEMDIVAGLGLSAANDLLFTQHGIFVLC